MTMTGKIRTTSQAPSVNLVTAKMRTTRPETEPTTVLSTTLAFERGPRKVLKCLAIPKPAKVVLNTVVGAVSGLIVLIFAVTKFTEGAWLVVLVFPIMVLTLLRLHRAYDREADLLEAVPSAEPVIRTARSCVVVLVDAVDQHNDAAAGGAD